MAILSIVPFDILARADDRKPVQAAQPQSIVAVGEEPLTLHARFPGVPPSGADMAPPRGYFDKVRH